MVHVEDLSRARRLAAMLTVGPASPRHLLPTTGLSQHDEQQYLETESCSPAQVQAIETTERKFAECMRSHGVPTWPDPTIDDHGRPVFNPRSRRHNRRLGVDQGDGYRMPAPGPDRDGP